MADTICTNVDTSIGPYRNRSRSNVLKFSWV